MIVAGEASGDKHGAALARALVELYPETRFEIFGSGGDEMRRAGVETLVDAREVAIIGVPEIIRALRKLFRAYRTLVIAARKRRPDVIVLVDWPDFNMRLARRLHREGFKVTYYISPQIWAWRRHRVRAIRRDIDRMLVILPFEEEFYRGAGVAVEYVGHPLLQASHATASREEYCRRHRLDPARPIIALLPGSRKKEIHYHLPAMLDAAGRLRIANLELRIEGTPSFYNASVPAFPQSAVRTPQFAIPLASTIDRIQIDQILNESSDDLDESVRIIEGETFNTLFHSSFAVVASGTATVEASLAGTPMIIVYRASDLNWRLIRPLIHLDTFGMVNLIAGRRIVPELIQHEVTGEKIAGAVGSLLCDPEGLARMKTDLAAVNERLRSVGGSASHRAASAVMRLANQPHHSA
jgi:lipid-A-disaccharide synthase